MKGKPMISPHLRLIKHHTGSRSLTARGTTWKETELTKDKPSFPSCPQCPASRLRLRGGRHHGHRVGGASIFDLLTCKSSLTAVLLLYAGPVFSKFKLFQVHHCVFRNKYFQLLIRTFSQWMVCGIKSCSIL